MADTPWLWERRTPRQVEAELVPADDQFPAVPAFDREWFTQRCVEARAEIEEKLAAHGFPGASVAYDPRLVVLASYFLAYDQGACDETAVVRGVGRLTSRLVDNPTAALLGYEIAIAGFIAMGRPALAEACAHAAVSLLTRGGLLLSPVLEREQDSEVPQEATHDAE